MFYVYYIHIVQSGLLWAYDTGWPDTRRYKDVFVGQDIKTSARLSSGELKPGVCQSSQGELSRSSRPPAAPGQMMETQQRGACVCTICFFPNPWHLSVVRINNHVFNHE